MISYLIFAFLGIVFIFYLTSRLTRAPARRISVFSIKNLLNPPRSTTCDLLHQRALPNQRLVRAFGLTNTFVSSDPTIHKAFRKHTTTLLHTAPSWPQFQATTSQAVEAYLHNTIPDFSTFIHVVTLHTILIGLLGIDTAPAGFALEDLITVTSGINRLWSLSKRPGPIPAEERDTINYHLRRLIQDEATYPNPLDFVIPIWETLWRVVATVLARTHHDDRAQRVFKALLDTPTHAQFEAFEGTLPSAQAMVAEAMRLHPPSKHISRAVPHTPHLRALATAALPRSISACLIRSLGPSMTRIEFADIEAVQRSDVWGDDADVFDPMRHSPARVTPAQKETLMAFGFGNLKCVAAAWAPMAVGVIVGAILEGLEQEGCQIVSGERIGGREGWDGWFIRRT